MKQSLQNILTLLVLVFYFGGGMLKAQFQKPFITYFSPKEYDAYFQNWQILQDKSGVIYVANNFGVLKYNGYDWKRISKPNESIIRSMYLDNDTLWVGGYNELGYFANDSTGNQHYVSIVDSTFNSGNVWQIEKLGNKFYAATDNFLIAFNSDTLIQYKVETFQTIAKVNNLLFFSNHKSGLQKIQNGKSDTLPNAKQFSGLKIYGINDFSDSLLLITPRDTDLLLYNYLSGKTTTFGSKELNNVLKKSVIYGCVKLKDGNWCFYTRKNGIVIANHQGELLNVFNKSTGLKSSTCWYVFEDKQSNLWLCLDKGISKVEYGTPFSWYNDYSGIDGVIMDVIEFDNRLYVASSTGLLQSNDFSKNKNTIYFSTVENCLAQTWDFEIVNDKLYIASSDGLFELKKSGEKPEIIINDKVVYALKASQYYSNTLYVGFDNGLGVIDISGRKNHLYTVDKVQAQIRSIEEEDEKNVWLGTYGDRAILLQRNDEQIPWQFQWVREFSEKDNLPGYEVDVFKISDKIIFSTDYGLMKHKTVLNDSIRFEPFCAFGKKYCDGSRLVYRIKQDYHNQIWMYFTVTNDDEEPGTLGFFMKVRNQYLWNYQAFNRLPEGNVFCFYPQNEHNMWIGGTEGLFLYNLDKPAVNIHSIFYTLINNVSTNDDSIIFNGNFIDENLKSVPVQQKEFIPQLSFNQHNLTFTFSATNYIDEKRTKFSYYLEGYDKKWSGWTTEHKKQYTNLPEGKYTFRVKSKDIFGNEGIHAKYSFIILPPWYRTAWAYVLYTLLLFVLIYLIIRVSVYRLKQANKKLELIVQERTKQVVEKNKQLNAALKDIHDSIGYAKRLQDSMLPQLSELKKCFSDAFVYYVPRDIVSGDFYWVHRSENETILAVADCTGHGVPGAFVSMLGYNMLNQIIFEKNVSDAGMILTLLNKGIQKVFHQNSKEQNVHDGMDIAIIKISGNKIFFAGANRPLIYVDGSGEIQQVKPDKKGIGGRTDYNFKFSTIELNKNEVSFCYLFSDGYPDQFGGPKGKKFLLKRFIKLLSSINNMSADAQNMVIKTTFEEWKANADQIDDVLVVGVKM